MKSTKPRRSLRRPILALLLPLVACGVDAASPGVDERGAPPSDAHAPARGDAPSTGTAAEGSASLRAAYIAAVQGDADERYRVEPSAGGVVRAQNPAQRFVAEMDGASVRLEPEAEAEGAPAWRASMAVAGYGCAGDLAEPAMAAPLAEDNRIEIRRADFVEWYESGPLGLEQGFTLDAPPACRRAGGGEVTFEVALDGDLAPELDEGGASVTLRDGNGVAALRVSDLFVKDAAGTALPARFTVEGDRITIAFDDAGAVYPVVVDPLISMQQAKLEASDAMAGTDLGYSAALSGDTAILGAPYQDVSSLVNAGAAYVFVRNGATWTQQARLTPTDKLAYDYFGWAVALDGDTAIVGSIYTDPNGNQSGGAYAFVRSAGVWTQQAKFVGSDVVAGDHFGKAVALSGDTALVGASDKSNTGFVNDGAAYVFVRSGGAWTEQAKLVPTNPASSEYFGIHLDVDGDTAVFGVPNNTNGNGQYAGAAFVFVRTGSTWAQQAKLTANGGVGGDWFGTDVAVSGDTMIVGAGGDNVGSVTDAGSAYVFTRSGTWWTQNVRLTAAVPVQDANFGYRVALDGDIAVAAAPHYYGLSGIGSASVFLRDGSTWAPQGVLLANDGVAGDIFGYGLAVSGMTVLAGAYLHNTAAGADAGAGYVFTLQKQPIGDTCNANAECQSGFCVDNVCCSSACGGSDDGDCQVCSVAKGAAVNGTCAPVSAGTVCRASAGACDVAETCNGASTACPADAKVAAGTTCRASSGICDVAETCDGAAVDCPADGVATAGTTCRAAAGDCDKAEVCDGTAKTCPTDAVATNGTVCRASAGVCDIAEKCNGVSKNCPADAFDAVKTCRAAGGLCDVAEKCDGTGPDCPADTLLAAGTTCRAKSGACDVAEICDGIAPTCPSDGVALPGTVCRAAADACDVAETCNGASKSCPSDGLAPAGTECRPAAGDCDAAESCNGIAKACPIDTLKAAGTACRAAAGACDVAEACDGASADCPADDKVGQGTVCRPANGDCDVAESCDGTNADCPSDGVADATVTCRAAVGPCDVADKCDGAGKACPADAVADVNVICREAAGPCDIAEKCDGATKGCSADIIATSAVVCRPAAGECDVAESCTGVGPECPADVTSPDGTTCKGGVCEAGACTGEGGAGGAGGGAGGAGGGAGGGQGGAGGGAGGGQGGGPSGTGGTDPGGTPAEEGSCGCRVAGDEPARSPWAHATWLAFAAALLGRKRARRR